jgi:hypothetical protein
MSHQQNQQFQQPLKAEPTPLTRAAMQFLKEQSAPIGGLQDNHVKWLILFTKSYFTVDNAVMAFDFHSTPKRIFIQPIPKKDDHFGHFEWTVWRTKLKYGKVEKDLPSFLGLDQFTIEFCRVAPEGNRIETTPAPSIVGGEPPAQS